MLKLKLQYFGHLIQIADSLEKSLMLRKIEGSRSIGHQGQLFADGVHDTNSIALRSVRGIAEQIQI